MSKFLLLRVLFFYSLPSCLTETLSIEPVVLFVSAFPVQ